MLEIIDEFFFFFIDFFIYEELLLHVLSVNHNKILCRCFFSSTLWWCTSTEKSEVKGSRKQAEDKDKNGVLEPCCD